MLRERSSQGEEGSVVGEKLYGFSMLDEDGGFLFSVFPSYLQYLDQRLQPEGDVTQCVVPPEAL